MKKNSNGGSGHQFPEPPERLIRKLSELLKTNDLAEIELASGELRLRLRARETDYRPQASLPASNPSPMPQEAAPKTEKQASSDLHMLRSPFVGTFYRSPSPDSAPFVEEGQSVGKGTVLCIVEAMKIMNEIEADTSGVVEKIYAEDGTPVDFNTALLGIRKA